jgi:GAF domain-containing protein/HAMP domain-containing protein
MSMPVASSFPEKTQPKRTRSQRFWNALLRLGIKLPLMVIFLVALAFTISTYLNIQATQATLVEMLKNELAAQTNSKAELIRTNLIWTRSVATDLAAASESSNYNETDILNLLQNTLKRNEHVYGSTIAYEPNQFKAGLQYWAPYYSHISGSELKFSQLGTPEYNYFEWDWYTQPKTSREPVLSSPYYDEGGGEIWMVTWSVPFFNTETGEFKGVATADIAFSQMQGIIKGIRVGQKGYAFLLDGKGTILGIGDTGGFYHPMQDSMLSIAQSAQNAEWEQVVKQMLALQSGFASAKDAQGIPMFVSYTPIGIRTGWSLGLAYPQAELFEQTAGLQNLLASYAGGAVIVFGLILYLFTLSITQPIRRLTKHANRLTTEQNHRVDGGLIEPIEINTKDELEDLAEAFNQMSKNLARSFETLEQNVADRTRALKRSSLEFEIIAEVARDITIIRDLDTLLNVSANLIRERFGYYHVGVFLMDDRGEYAILRAAASAAASKMLEQNYRLRVGQGLVGNVIRTGQAHIASDIGKDAIHFQNPLLPLTRSEIALPLSSHNTIIGALDIQAEAESAFDERSIRILQLLADQITAAIENAQLAKQVTNTLHELNKTYRLQSQSAWQEAIEKRKTPAYEYDGIEIRAISRNISDSLLKQLENGKPVVIDENESATGIKTLMVPLMAFNQVIGIVGLEQDDPNHKWTENEIEIIEAAANRAALTLENTRLLEESQRRAEKERSIFEATARIGAVSNIENILHVTAEEIERVLRGSEVILQFSSNRKS